MNIYPDVEHNGYVIAVNPMLIDGRYFATFSIHKAGSQPYTVLQLPVMFQVGRDEAYVFDTAEEAAESATHEAKKWIDAIPK